MPTKKVTTKLSPSVSLSWSTKPLTIRWAVFGVDGHYVSISLHLPRMPWRCQLVLCRTVLGLCGKRRFDLRCVVVSLTTLWRSWDSLSCAFPVRASVAASRLTSAAATPARTGRQLFGLFLGVPSSVDGSIQLLGMRLRLQTGAQSVVVKVLICFT